MTDLKNAVMALDLKPTSIVFFDSDAIEGRQFMELNLDIDFAVTCIPVHIPHGKTLQECIKEFDLATIQELVNS